MLIYRTELDEWAESLPVCTSLNDVNECGECAACNSRYSIFLSAAQGRYRKDETRIRARKGQACIVEGWNREVARIRFALNSSTIIVPRNNVSIN